MGDLGQHFPDSDPIYQSIPSSELLEQIVAMLQERGYQINNVDATVIAEAPRLAKHIAAMRKNLSEILHISVSCVSVKASSNEKLGWIGRGEGIAAHAVVLLESSNSG